MGIRPLQLAVAVLMLALWAAPSSAGATAPQGGVIRLTIDASPDIRDVVSPTISLDGVDLTADYCAPADGTLACTGLPDGVYVIGADGAPDGTATHVECVDIVAARATEPIIDIDGGYTEWGCTISVGTPTIILSTGALSMPVPTGLRLELPPIDGQPSNCVPDTINVDYPAVRCTDLPLGEHQPMVVGTTENITNRIHCIPTFLGAGLDATPAATLTEEYWLWWCDLEPPAPNVELNVYGDPADTNVFVGPVNVDVSDAVPTVTGPNGIVGQECVSGAFVAPYRVQYVCSLPPATYTVEWSNLPEGNFVATCTSFEVVEPPQYDSQSGPVGCALEYQIPEPTATIPSTGAAEATTARLAVVLLLAGIGLVGISRVRRTRS